MPRDGSVIAIEIPKEKLREFCRKWKVTEFALFGSVTRPEEFRADSDVDVLVTFAPDARWSLFDHVHMRDDLVEIFGREVDLLTRRGVEQSRNYLRREAILSSAVLLEVA
jgi:predicted nucleotidyltransferase